MYRELQSKHKGGMCVPLSWQAPYFTCLYEYSAVFQSLEEHDSPVSVFIWVWLIKDLSSVEPRGVLISFFILHVST